MERRRRHRGESRAGARHTDRPYSVIAAITAAVEDALGVKLFDPSVYFISELPSDLQGIDVAVVVIASLLLSLAATLYPAWRASRIAPAEVLRYE